MSFAVLPIGSEIASGSHPPSQDFANLQVKAPQTLDDLVRGLTHHPPQDLALNHRKQMLSACSRLVDFLGKPMDEIALIEILERKSDFRPFLLARKYQPETIHSYVASMTRLLDTAKTFGWDPAGSLPLTWRKIFHQAPDERVKKLVLYLVRLRLSPSKVSEHDTDNWVNWIVAKGGSLTYYRGAKLIFWRLLRDNGISEEIPALLNQQSHYGIHLDNFPLELRDEVKALLNWKQAAFAPGRPKNGKMRPVSARHLKEFICRLYGFAVNVIGRADILSISQLVDRELLTSYAEWYINERKGKGTSVARNMWGFIAAVRHYPSLKNVDKSWFKEFQNSIPTDGDQESLEERKNRHYLEYDLIATIPDALRQKRLRAEEAEEGNVAAMAAEELLLRFLCTFAWRQRNLRELRIDGSKPNLFKGLIPPGITITRPKWVEDEERQNPDAEFWQIRFSKEETKTKIAVHAILPHQLIAPLEEYLSQYRPQLIVGDDPNTLFVKRNGSVLDENDVRIIVETLTARYRQVSVNPHHFRDIFAYAWLKDHPEDYLTLSKMLWHKTLDMTVKKYAARFNESTAICSLEGWLEARASRR